MRARAGEDKGKGTDRAAGGLGKWEHQGSGIARAAGVLGQRER